MRQTLLNSDSALCDLPSPESAREHKLDLEPHDELPEIEDGEIDDSGGEETPSPDDQWDRFKQAARDLECDEDEARWDERLRKFATHKPSGKPDAE